MPSKELIEKVARAIIENPPKINRLKDMEALSFSKVVDHTPTAEAAISTILAALQEPTEGMIDAALSAWQLRVQKRFRSGTLLSGGDGRQSMAENWRAMLTASALGEQSE